MCQSHNVLREVGDQLLIKAHHEWDSSFAKWHNVQSAGWIQCGWWATGLTGDMWWSDGTVIQDWMNKSDVMLER